MTSRTDGRRHRRWLAAPLLVTVMALGVGQGLAQPAISPEDDPIAGDPTSALVEVSLGDWSVKTSIAEKLSRKTSEIPLTVKVSPDIASDVCPLDAGDLEQQVVISPTRTCAAKKTTEALEAEVRKVVLPAE